MSEEASYDAIVLRRRDLGENDRRITLLTRERGKIDAIAKGARKGASRLGGATEPLAQIRVTLAARRNAYVTQVEPRASRPGLRTDYVRLGAALSLAELYAATTPYDQEDPHAFDLLEASLEAIETHRKPAIAALYAQVRLLEHIGVMPAFGHDTTSGHALDELEPYLSPTAGGYVRYQDADLFSDRFRSRYEVLVALDRIGQLDAPPANVRFVEQCLAALLPFWQHFAEALLPATGA
ncbi:MAG: DNA repair protein RecO, partial [Armatimonadota bacterium]